MGAENTSFQDISYQLLKDAEIFNTPELEEYKQIIILAIQSNNPGIQKIVHHFIENEKDALTGSKYTSSMISRTMLDSLLDCLSIIDSASFQDLIPDELPYIAPATFNKAESLANITKRVTKGRYYVPEEYKFRVKILLKNTVNNHTSLSANFLFNIDQFLLDHTTANEKPTTQSKWNEGSVRILNMLEFELKKACFVNSSKKQ